jgi:4a-hydroxytetrahydrobiopterin dehydratase
MSKLSETEIKEALADLPGWSVDGVALKKSFEFKNFRAAWTFMEDIAMEAEEMGHHPEWSNVYNKVDIKLSTHDEGGITEKDIDLATFINTAEQIVSAEDL